MKINKWINGGIPAFLMHLAVGTVYAFSLFIKPLSQYMGYSEFQIQNAFSLAIFFLGMSAAFGGKIVEKDIKKSSKIGIACFISGLVLTSIAVTNKSLWGLYLGYGIIHGIGLGITYLTPCKTVMLHFNKNRGFAMGLSIMGFGFASTFAAPIITNLLEFHVNDIGKIFFDLAVIYFIPMCLGLLLLKKPNVDGIDNNEDIKFSYKTLLKDKFFLVTWLVLFISTHCGLSLISIASPMLSELGGNAMLIALIISVMGLCNGGGRVIFSTMSDYLSHRVFIYLTLFSLSIIAVYSYIILPNIFTMGLMLCGISAFFGAAFSNIAPVLSDKYGMTNVSKIHGVVLSAWGVAGLTGSSMSEWIHELTGTYELIYPIISVLYTLGLLCTIYLCFNHKKMK